jgi:hypothetical protein
LSSGGPPSCRPESQALARRSAPGRPHAQSAAMIASLPSDRPALLSLAMRRHAMPASRTRVDDHTWTLLKNIAISARPGVGSQVDFGWNESHFVEAIRRQSTILLRVRWQVSRALVIDQLVVTRPKRLRPAALKSTAQQPLYGPVCRSDHQKPDHERCDQSRPNGDPSKHTRLGHACRLRHLHLCITERLNKCRHPWRGRKRD